MSKNEKQLSPEKAYKNLIKLKPFRDDGFYTWYFDEKGILSKRDGRFRFPADVKKFPKFRKPASWYGKE